MGNPPPWENCALTDMAVLFLQFSPQKEVEPFPLINRAANGFALEQVQGGRMVYSFQRKERPRTFRVQGLKYSGNSNHDSAAKRMRQNSSKLHPPQLARNLI